ncbi:hypothetical protein [Streptomyces sp. NPDC127190]|uniref:hypothetical protein n=1 Tax=unclassified Streptomyces TaxID=2593676 RepID=UPI003634C2C4
MSPTDPAFQELLAVVRSTPQEAVDHLLRSDDPHVRRLARAIRDVRRDATSRDTPTPPDEPLLHIDPVTHDPAW